MELIVIQGFIAYITALFYTVMRYKDYIITSNRDFFKQIDYITNTIGSLTPD